MEIITKTELQLRYEEVLQRIQDGAVFIKPTDTIYGLSCNALNKKAVEKIREIKDRATNPFSVVAPSLDWIRKNCFLDKKALGWLDKLPGPYTLITKLKNKKASITENFEGLGSIKKDLFKSLIISILILISLAMVYLLS